MIYLLPPIVDVYVLVLPFIIYRIWDWVCWRSRNSYIQEKAKYDSYRDYFYSSLYSRKFFTVMMSPRWWFVQFVWAFVMFIPLLPMP